MSVEISRILVEQVPVSPLRFALTVCFNLDKEYSLTSVFHNSVLWSFFAKGVQLQFLSVSAYDLWTENLPAGEKVVVEAKAVHNGNQVIVNA